ncbi:CPA_1a_G0045970.mRNA.1.CDS.1 [Saccharomyces cerevisiae]|nr:CPA_1a_G0045970.mRNA.1.CDS.1 [Saccharomyces cerevisiae]CAI4721886.1 CPI_1c_G0045130.mRNA.1.CDS.1 [Saccharomyces cerevisiae]CAI4734882.1 BBM_1a_G0045250.mRNA.1.CDS.1 [Saccharomyces cerevisiae]CAI7303101.1 BBM_1a_G0045250.mRNA.1.CDS.1 [Saccharomyces cerevisiae]CAI7442534.1 CPI_1c_G0045130.mRNA.1.CDS.1 [Saccharomyces cerevisiae]
MREEGSELEMEKGLLKWKPVNLMKKILSLPMKKTKNDIGLRLDISYILVNLIVCSYPVNTYPKLLYRNSLDDLILFLTVYHGKGNFRIFNFRGEKEDSDYKDNDLIGIAAKYESKDFEIQELRSTLINDGKIPISPIDLETRTLVEEETNNVICERIGWLDHFPPPFELLEEIVDGIENYLSVSKNRVAVLHCRMGKGRSGMITVAYLMKYLQCPLGEARLIFMQARFKYGMTNGVTIPSQLRYLRYHEFFITHEKAAQEGISNEAVKFKFKFRLAKMTFLRPSSLITSESAIVTTKIQHYNDDRNALLTRKVVYSDIMAHECGGNMTFIFGRDYLTLENDCRIEFTLETSKSKAASSIISWTSCASCWLNIYLETLMHIIKDDSSPDYFQVERLKRDEMLGTTISWQELDGFGELSTHGLKLFQALKLEWEII